MISTLEQAKSWQELQARLFCDNLGRATFSAIPQAVILWIVWGVLATPVIIIFGLAAVALHSWRSIAIYQSLRAAEPDETYWDQVCRKISRISVLHGILNALIAAVCIPVAGPQWGVGIALIILGIQAGAIATLTAMPIAFISYSIPLLIGVSTGIYLLNPETGFIVAPLYMLLLFVLYAAVERFVATLRQTWELRAERNRALSNAEDANHQKTLFLAAASHDLRQPAAALAFMAEELIERNSDADLEPIAANIQRSSDNIRTLLDKLFDLSRLDTPLISNSPQWCSLEDIGMTLDSIMGVRASAKNLQFSADGFNGYLWADLTYLQRLLSNLIDNSLKYTETGSITVSFSTNTTHATFVVSDTGRGIEPELLQQIWNENVPASARSQSTFSLGLGLSIVTRLVKLVNATIHVDSSVGQGTSVRVQFPISQYQSTSNSSNQESTGNGPMLNAHGHLILLVEDNTDVRQAISRHLKRLGFEVESVADAATARKRLASATDYAVMITDYRLPDNEVGTTLIDFANSDGHQLPCLVISADDITEQLKDYQDQTAYLRKPIQTYELHKILGELLNKSGGRPGDAMT